jgi:hypothetical protein
MAPPCDPDLLSWISDNAPTLESITMSGNESTGIAHHVLAGRWPQLRKVVTRGIQHIAPHLYPSDAAATRFFGAHPLLDHIQMSSGFSHRIENFDSLLNLRSFAGELVS